MALTGKLLQKRSGKAACYRGRHQPFKGKGGGGGLKISTPREKEKRGGRCKSGYLREGEGEGAGEESVPEILQNRGSL